DPRPRAARPDGQPQAARRTAPQRTAHEPGAGAAVAADGGARGPGALAVTVDTRPLRPPRFADAGLLTLGAIAVMASLWTTAVLGMPGLLRYVALGAAGLAVVLTLAWRRPAQSLAWLPVLIVPPQLVKVFAYEVVLLIGVACMLLYAWLRGLRWAVRM